VLVVKSFAVLLTAALGRTEPGFPMLAVIEQARGAQLVRIQLRSFSNRNPRS
jgi:hypothetical protein